MHQKVWCCQILLAWQLVTAVMAEIAKQAENVGGAPDSEGVLFPLPSAFRIRS